MGKQITAEFLLGLGFKEFKDFKTFKQFASRAFQIRIDILPGGEKEDALFIEAYEYPPLGIPGAPKETHYEFESQIHSAGWEYANNISTVGWGNTEEEWPLVKKYFINQWKLSRIIFPVVKEEEDY